MKKANLVTEAKSVQKMQMLGEDNYPQLLKEFGECPNSL